jgi:rhamnosyltransferase
LENRNLLAGYLLLYHPTSAILDNVTTYLHVVNVLYVVDNSDKKFDTALINQLCLLSAKIVFLPQKSNLGYAAGQNIGAEMATVAGYKWLLQMDQDSYLTGDTFISLWQSEILDTNDVGLISASYTESYDRWQKKYNDNFNEIHFAISSGNIINLNIWKEVNGFEEKLFIDEIDHDYCLKLRRHHYKVLITKKILLQHTIGYVHKEVDDLSKEKEISLHIPLRYYYMARNVLYVCKKYMFNDFKFVIRRFFYLIKMFCKIILIYPNKRAYLRYFFAGVKDFIGGNYYKYKE